MGHLEFCSNCGEKNKFGTKDGNKRRYCSYCKTIHYENPKPTATLICPNNKSILLVKRAKEPGKNQWGLPGGFIEKGETLQEGAMRELFEETNLKGQVKQILGTCSHFNTIFGDILLIGIEIIIHDWSKTQAGDDVAEATLFPIKNLPDLAFPCYDSIIKMYLNKTT